MVTDEIWAQSGATDDLLCVGCLEERLGGQLGPDDFPMLPINDDEAIDSVRLRTRKGSGRRVEGLYELGMAAVLELGHEPAQAAKTLGLDERLLVNRVESLRSLEDEE